VKHKSSNTSETGSRISFIYFDLGGVLTRWKPALEQIAKSSGKSKAELKRVFWKYAHEAGRGKLSAQQVWQHWHEELNIGPQTSWDFWTQGFVKIPETHALVEELARQYKIGLLSNIEHGLFENLYAKQHVPHQRHFHTIIKSCDVGFIKPEREIYALAEKRAGVPAGEILFIDDLEENVTAAMSRGWQGIMFNEDEPELSIRTLRSLLLSKKPR